jgi:hypothetical protein
MSAWQQNVDSLYSDKDRREDSRRLAAIGTLRKLLEDHPEGVLRSEVLTLARESGIKWGLMWKVAAVLGVQRLKTVWQLPGSPRDNFSPGPSHNLEAGRVEAEQTIRRGV